ncbi:MAG: GntR family transcriptional regulator [Chloroflexi bacterium OLB15]|nr:MAG: GntR family transcriptional regulator [Chloroflexi bacterium OLB15]
MLQMYSNVYIGMVTFMLPKIERSGPIPIYQQIKDWMRHNIHEGTWPEHYQLQAEDELAAELNVNRGTLRNAIKSLTDEGLLIRIHGKGTFVAGKKVEQPLAETLITFSEGLIQQHIAYTTSVLRQEIICADEEMAAIFKVSVEEPLLCLQRVRYVEHKPIIFFTNYTPVKYFPQIELKDFAHRRLFDVMEYDYRVKISWAQRYFEACVADAQVASALDISVGDPVMYGKQITYSESNIAIEASDIWIRGDSFRLSATVLRGDALNLLNGAPEIMQSIIRI